MTTMSQDKVWLGSVLHTDNGALWYSCGRWGVSSDHFMFPAILGYVPVVSFAQPGPESQFLSTPTRDYWKVFDVPDNDYHTTLRLAIPFNGTAHPPLGKVVFLSKDSVCKILNPLEYLRPCMDTLPKQSLAIKMLAERANIPMSALGVTGSTLVFGRPVERHELDLLIVGKDNIAKFDITVNALLREGLATHDAFYAQRFHLHGVTFDPQYDLFPTECHPLAEASIEILDECTDIRVKIVDTCDAVLFPARYLAEENLILYSFRPGHRCLFSVGDVIVISTAFRAVINRSGIVETALLVTGLVERYTN